MRLQYLPRRRHLKHVWNAPSQEPLQTNYYTRNSRNNSIVSRPLRTIASHELLHELLRQQRTIAASDTPCGTHPFSEHPKNGVSKMCPGHFLDTPERHPMGKPRRHPRFGGHSRGPSSGHFGPQRPDRLLC